MTIGTSGQDLTDTGLHLLREHRIAAEVTRGATGREGTATRTRDLDTRSEGFTRRDHRLEQTRFA